MIFVIFGAILIGVGFIAATVLEEMNKGLSFVDALRKAVKDDAPIIITGTAFFAGLLLIICGIARWLTNG